MHEVGVGARPTLVASRSHNTLYYTHADPWWLLSRYNDRWVQSQHRVEPMLGPAGGGFLFDTNSLHRGQVEGNRSRLTVILEFHRHGKVPHLLKHNNPCPSIKSAPRVIRSAARAWQAGVRGLTLYPAEGRQDVLRRRLTSGG